MFKKLKQWFKGDEAPRIPIQEGGGNFTPGEASESLRKCKENPSVTLPAILPTTFHDYRPLYLKYSVKPSYPLKTVLAVYDALKAGLTIPEICESQNLTKYEVQGIKFGYVNRDVWLREGMETAVPYRGKSARYKLCVDDVRKIRWYSRQGYSISWIHAHTDLDVHYETIRDVVNRRTWSHII